MSRSGLQTIIKLLKHFCRVVATYQARLNAAIDAAPIGTSQQKQDAKAAISAIVALCPAIVFFETVFEP